MLWTILALLLVILVSVVNLALGFWFAIKIGRGPKSWDHLMADLTEPLDVAPLRAAHAPKPRIEAPVATPKEPAPVAKTGEAPPPAVEHVDEAPESFSIEELPEAPPPLPALDERPLQAEPFAETTFGEIPPEFRPIERVAARAAQLMACCEENFTRFYGKLGEPNAESMNEASPFALQLGRLVERHLNYLDTTLLGLQRLQPSAAESAAGPAHEALNWLSLHFNETQPILVSLQRGGEDFAQVRARLTGVLDAIVHACRSTRDRLENTLPDLVASHGNLAAVHEELFAAERGVALGRLLLEHTLAVWTENQDEQTPVYSAGAVDVDEFGGVNQSFGSGVANLLLEAVERIVRTECGDEAIVFRLGGDRFYFLLAGYTGDDAVQTAEQIRQTIDKSTFTINGRQFRATVCAAAAEIDLQQSGEDLLERLHGGLDEAKSYGRNRSFIIEGEYPTLVVPPKLEIQETVTSV